MFAPPPAPALYRKIAFSFLALTVLILIGALWISSVRARITIKVRPDTASIQTAIEVAKNPIPGQLHGRVVQGTFEKIQEFGVQPSSATTSVDVNSIFQGRVKLINTYSKSQTLVKTTRLLTADKRLYRIDKTIVVPSKQSIEVTAQADAHGASYALPIGTRLSIPGLWIDLQKFIYADTVTVFSPGSHLATVTKLVNLGDVNEAQKILEDVVFEQAKKTLRAEAGVGEDWKVVYQKKVVDKKSNVSPGQRADQFLASIKLQVTAVYYPDRDMEALIRQKLKEKLPEGRNLLKYDPAQVTLAVEEADIKLEKARLIISAKASSRLTEQSPQFVPAQFVGLAQEEVKAKLLSIDGVENVDIRIRPAWSTKLPSLQTHIELIVQ